MSLLIKICGVTREADVEAAAQAGADAVGFVFHASSRRNLAPARAAELAGALPARVLRVAVTLHPTPMQVSQVLAAFMPDVWQSDLEDFGSIDIPPGIWRWPVLRAGAPAIRALPQTVLFDAAVSGSGLRADWETAGRLARRRRLIISGGLDAASVGPAIERVRPVGVDVSSGVESRPGVKDGVLIRRFVAAARAAVRSLPA